ncbi:D-alanyl-D-alanine carboxypeptidase/D-alanyl-D-alanine-endopeptidase [Leisingera aquaemixtae]|uniref:D-alanyl-D-alanine carboxypeptidase/D-alanyl-D-alanine endopeptidase n=1 Tax=Leisingera aquaemixtae TaxID=1396826 RepID=UPI001C9604F8|nr:D-alanyl-D-alanine carboxypeptidase/D-alanyl-D-alanine-endopeptidase [Leisingera aquaemixtae]MBY6068782.1 D-alanyl-D-alanine carboxypeptidase/D-alanyl-D-alanine-endopeptidase [Leisingera aquaemixtae]
MTSRRTFLLSGLAALAGTSALANAPAVSLRPVARRASSLAAGTDGLKALLERAGLPGHAVCAVADVKSGKLLESSGGGEALPPASVAKALTALYALDVLGADHRFETRVLATGGVAGGVVNGDLILAGGGDPMLNTDHLALLAKALKTAGVREVRGKFLVWDGALPGVKTIDPDQPDHVGYSPAVSGISLNFNRVHFEWKRAASGNWAITMDARTEKYRPEVATARMAIQSRAVPVYTYADKGGVDHWTVASKALGKGGARWLPVRNPAAYAGDVFRTLVRANGIALPQARSVSALPAATLLAQHHSPPLDVMLKAMLKYSNNLMAEMIGMSASAARAGRPASLQASAAEMSAWAAGKYGMSGTRLVDHSGLGEASRMTPADLTRALVAAYKSGQLKPLLKPFQMRDAKGRTVKGHPIKVAAKTGTLNFVSGLGGFMTAADGTELAFAIFTADLKTRGRIPRAQRERPPGARSWNRRAKKLQQQLIERWGAVYGS